MHMKRIIFAISLLITSSTSGFAMDSLAELRWNKRILVLFAEATNPKLEQQLGLLATKAADLSDRDMVVLHVTSTDVKAIYGKVGNADARKLRSEAGVESAEFTAILIGKDGGEKLRSDDVVGDRDLFDLIDSMPMRKAGQK